MLFKVNWSSFVFLSTTGQMRRVKISHLCLSAIYKMWTCWNRSKQLTHNVRAWACCLHTFIFKAIFLGTFHGCFSFGNCWHDLFYALYDFISRLGNENTITHAPFRFDIVMKIIVRRVAHPWIIIASRVSSFPAPIHIRHPHRHESLRVSHKLHKINIPQRIALVWFFCLFDQLDLKRTCKCHEIVRMNI